MLRNGDTAPDFSLFDQQGNLFVLSQALAQSNVVIFFYPKDNSLGCTIEACTFRNYFSDFAVKNAIIVGISADSQSSHQLFSQKHQLTYKLLSDPEGATANLYGLQKTLGILPQRATFVVNQAGTIKLALSSQLNVRRHVYDALSAL